MLYNPHTTHCSYESIKAWLDTKPDDERYFWNDPTICACAQYLTQIVGLNIDRWSKSPLWQGYSERYNIRQLNNLASAYRTFGELRNAVERRRNDFRGGSGKSWVAVADHLL